uniref:Uncharacterized protein n=1 Tax=uncultured prokaryote TaxID=198431 RepID=A0A0H5QN57_9ZZZZ|nr:hypothetical protein [uncultured prokaryote]
MANKNSFLTSPGASGFDTSQTFDDYFRGGENFGVPVSKFYPTSQDGSMSSITLPNGEVLKNPYYGNTAHAGWFKRTFSPGRVAQEQQAMDAQASEWYNSQLQALYADWYSSPEQESARMKAAGMNPALTGLTGAASAMAGNPASGVDPIVGDSPIGAGDIVNVVSSLFSITTSLVNSGFDFASKASSLQAQKLANTDMMQDLAANDILHELGPDIASRGATNNDILQQGFIHGLTIPYRQIQGSKGKRSGLSNNRHDGQSRGWNRKMTRMYNEAVSRFGNSAKTKGELYKVLKDYQDNRKGFLSSVSGDLYSDIDSVFAKSLDSIISAYNKTVKTGYESTAASNEYNKQFYDSLDAQLGASARNSENELTVNEKDNSNFQAEFINNLMSDLKRAAEAKDASTWDKILYVGAILLRSSMFSNMKLNLSVPRSKSSSKFINK